MRKCAPARRNRRRKRGVRFGVAAAMVVTAIAAAANAQTQARVEPPAESLVFTTEHRPPNNWLDETTRNIVGPNADVLRAMIDRLGWRAEFRLYSWSRSYMLAKTTPGVCVFSTIRSRQRAPEFRWIGPIGAATFAMIARKGGGISLRSLEEARGYTVGLYTQDVRVAMLRDMGGFTLDVASEDLLNARKLAAGRIDLWFTDLEAYAQVDPALRATLEIVLRLENRPLYLACHRETPEPVVKAMNRALAALDGEGRIEAIRKRYRTPG